MTSARPSVPITDPRGTKARREARALVTETWALVGLLAIAAVVAIAAVFHAARMSVRYRLGRPGRASDPAFEHVLAGLTNSATLPVQAAELLTEVPAIYDAMLAAIAAAEASVTFETYLFWNGRVADRFAAAFAERARAGVPVKVLLDHEGSRSIAADTVALMRDAGVELRFFQRFTWRQPLRYNQRTHRKILVVDGREGFTGGIGVADMWLGPPAWCELGLRLTGPAVALLQGTFFQHWTLAGGALELGPGYFPPEQPGAAGPLAMVTTSAPSFGDSMVGLLFIAAITAAERRVAIVSPYFLPGEEMCDALSAAARRGVEVQVLVPGPRNDNPFAYQASRRLYRSLLAAGVRIAEYQPAMMHAKALVIDGRWTMLGSANFDPRSLFLNQELNVSIGDARLACCVEAFVADALTRSAAVTPAELAATPWPRRLIGVIGLAMRDQL